MSNENKVKTNVNEQKQTQCIPQLNSVSDISVPEKTQTGSNVSSNNNNGPHPWTICKAPEPVKEDSSSSHRAITVYRNPALESPDSTSRYGSSIMEMSPSRSAEMQIVNQNPQTQKPTHFYGHSPQVSGGSVIIDRETTQTTNSVSQQQQHSPNIQRRPDNYYFQRPGMATAAVIPPTPYKQVPGQGSHYTSPATSPNNNGNRFTADSQLHSQYIQYDQSHPIRSPIYNSAGSPQSHIQLSPTASVPRSPIHIRSFQPQVQQQSPVPINNRLPSFNPRYTQPTSLPSNHSNSASGFQSHQQALMRGSNFPFQRFNVSSSGPVPVQSHMQSPYRGNITGTFLTSSSVQSQQHQQTSPSSISPRAPWAHPAQPENRTRDLSPRGQVHYYHHQTQAIGIRIPSQNVHLSNSSPARYVIPPPHGLSHRQETSQALETFNRGSSFNTSQNQYHGIRPNAHETSLFAQGHSRPTQQGQSQYISPPNRVLPNSPNNIGNNTGNNNQASLNVNYSHLLDHRIGEPVRPRLEVRTQMPSPSARVMYPVRVPHYPTSPQSFSNFSAAQEHQSGQRGHMSYGWNERSFDFYDAVSHQNMVRKFNSFRRLMDVLCMCCAASHSASFAGASARGSGTSFTG